MSTTIKPDQRAAMLAAFDGRCVWCGAAFAPGVRVTVDHLMPQAASGPNRPPNLAPSHERCNFRRSHIPPADWAMICSLRGQQPNVQALRAALLALSLEPVSVGSYARKQLRRLEADARLRPIPWQLVGSPTVAGGVTHLARAA